MTQSTIFPPTPIAELPSLCATCPFFSDHNDARGCGWCEIFNISAKKHHFRTSDCDRSIESLLKQPKTCMVKVELITEAVEDDGSGHAVPVDSRTVEVMVAQPIRALVELAIATRKDLQDWQVADFWQPDGEEGFEI